MAHMHAPPPHPLHLMPCAVDAPTNAPSLPHTATMACRCRGVLGPNEVRALQGRYLGPGSAYLPDPDCAACAHGAAWHVAGRGAVLQCRLHNSLAAHGTTYRYATAPPSRQGRGRRYGPFASPRRCAAIVSLYRSVPLHRTVPQVVLVDRSGSVVTQASPCLLYRDPGLHPADVRLAQLVPPSQAFWDAYGHGLRNALVMPTQVGAGARAALCVCVCARIRVCARERE